MDNKDGCQERERERERERESGNYVQPAQLDDDNDHDGDIYKLITNILRPMKIKKKYAFFALLYSTANLS